MELFPSAFTVLPVSWVKNRFNWRLLPGTCSVIDDIRPGDKTELIALTHNETSTGVMQPSDEIYQVRRNYPDILISLDSVSILPTVEFDYSQVDTAYFSVQKCFGLPAGLGVWILNDKCLERAETLKAQGNIAGTYHSLESLAKTGAKNQTPETPNVLGLYLLGKVAEDMLDKGVEVIRRETVYKAAVLYKAVDDCPFLEPFVKEEAHRSPTVVVAEVKDKTVAEVMTVLGQAGLIVGRGYGEFKEKHIRIANFPTHSKEKVEQLADLLTSLS